MPHELEYVITGAFLDCSEGTVPAPFQASPRNIRIQGLKVGNASDKVPITNIPSFVICKKLTQQAGGTPVPCVPAPQQWQDTHPVQVNRSEVLIFKSCIRCTTGQGKIEFLSSGQTPLPPEMQQQIDQMKKESDELLQEAQAEQNAVGESGFLEGMIPVWGSGRDMIHSIQTGNVGGALLNGAFLAWDVASIAAGVVSFGTATVAMQGAKAGLRSTLKAGVKVASRELAQKAAQLTAKALLTKEALKKGIKALTSTRVCVIACFPAGTPVSVPNGYKNIEELRAGDQVWSRHEETGALSLKRVVQTIERETDHLVHLRLGGDRISTTAEHPFWVGSGWKKAGQLVVGDEVVRSDGIGMRVLGVEHQTEFEQPVTVYNIEVADWHTYLVGKWRLWVHNATICFSILKKLLQGKRYLKEIEQITNLKIHPKQIEKLKEALRNKNYQRLSIEDTEKARRAFARKKAKAIADWERETGQKWPRYKNRVYDKDGNVAREVGEPYDAHHIIENTYGGDHEWWNIHPARFPDQHQAGIHGKGSTSRKVFPRKRK